jgi:hypothetical protein
MWNSCQLDYNVLLFCFLMYLHHLEECWISDIISVCGPKLLFQIYFLHITYTFAKFNYFKQWFSHLRRLKLCWCWVPPVETLVVPSKILFSTVPHVNNPTHYYEDSAKTPSFFFNFYFFIIHMCIQCLGHFSTLPPHPPLPSILPSPFPPPPPQYPAETILPLFLILLKREYKQW